MSEILAQMLCQLKMHITKELSQRACTTKMDSKLLGLEHAEIQKAHMEMRKMKDDMEKAQASLHTTMKRVYQKISGEGMEALVEEKIRKVNDMFL